jgi:hypothetical protein
LEATQNLFSASKPTLESSTESITAGAGMNKVCILHDMLEIRRSYILL